MKDLSTFLKENIDESQLNTYDEVINDIVDVYESLESDYDSSIELDKLKKKFREKLEKYFASHIKNPKGHKYKLLDLDTYDIEDMLNEDSNKFDKDLLEFISNGKNCCIPDPESDWEGYIAIFKNRVYCCLEIEHAYAFDIV